MSVFSVILYDRSPSAWPESQGLSIVSGHCRSLGHAWCLKDDPNKTQLGVQIKSLHYGPLWRRGNGGLHLRRPVRSALQSVVHCTQVGRGPKVKEEHVPLAGTILLCVGEEGAHWRGCFLPKKKTNRTDNLCGVQLGFDSSVDGIILSGFLGQWEISIWVETGSLFLLKLYTQTLCYHVVHNRFPLILCKTSSIIQPGWDVVQRSVTLN